VQAASFEMIKQWEEVYHILGFWEDSYRRMRRPWSIV
jgi:hypothetical protein